MQARPDPTLPFNWTIRVYFEDTDAQGLVYFANYLKYGARARSEWLRQLDIESGRLAAQDNLALVVHRIEASYRAAARLDDQLRVESQLTRVQAARFYLRQDIWRDDSLLFESEVEVAVVDSERQKPLRLPDWMRKRFTALI